MGREGVGDGMLRMVGEGRSKRECLKGMFGEGRKVEEGKKSKDRLRMVKGGRGKVKWG